MTARAKFTEFLKDPYVDKVLGFLAVAPAFYNLYQYWGLVQMGWANMFTTAIAAGSVVLIATVIIRRTAKRVSLNPFFWLVTAMRNYWATVVLNYIYILPLHPLVPSYITNAIFYAAVAVILYSRVSLGRNIGFIPARRELVTTGAYGIVRHPIHTGELLYFLSFILIGYSPLNWSLLFLGSGFVIWKSLVEENFLKEDADYREYCKKVPYRWIPGVI